MQDKDAWAIERQEIVAQLRSFCEEYGDNDWPDELHLADVLEKHLYRHVDGMFYGHMRD